ncbi:MAG: hypothetical protein Q9165_007649 [Trypethelium subeluteriae]
MSVDDGPLCQTVLSATIARRIQQEITNDREKSEHSPLLVGFLSNGDPAARMYADWTAKTCVNNGFQFQLREVDREELEDRLVDANRDENVDGIIVYYPVFGNRQDQYLQQIVDVSKDVEGLNHTYIFNLYQNIRFLDEEKLQKSVLPCTPLAVVKILEYLQIYNPILPYGSRLFGHTVTVINRSEVVGRPLAALLANDGATLYSVDVTGVQIFSRGEGIRKRRHDVTEAGHMSLESCLPLSDVVISGVPGESFKIPIQHIKSGACCINFSSEKNFPPGIKEKASIYVPAIGKVTIVILLRNLLVSVRYLNPLLKGY